MIAGLKKRKGFNHFWDQIDEDTKYDILKDLIGVARAERIKEMIW